MHSGRIAHCSLVASVTSGLTAWMAAIVVPYCKGSEAGANAGLQQGRAEAWIEQHQKRSECNVGFKHACSPILSMSALGCWPALQGCHKTMQLLSGRRSPAPLANPKLTRSASTDRFSLVRSWATRHLAKRGKRWTAGQLRSRCCLSLAVTTPAPSPLCGGSTATHCTVSLGSTAGTPSAGQLSFHLGSLRR